MIVDSPERMYGDLKNVIGVPHSFLKNTDPDGRAFNKHMMRQAPLVMIRPGRVKFSEDTTQYIVEALNKFGRAVTLDNIDSTMIGAGSDGNSPARGALFNKEYGVAKEDLAAIDAAIAEKQKGTVRDFLSGNDKSVRFFEFQTNQSIIREYQSVLHTLTSRVYSRLEDKAVSWANVSNTWKPAEMTNGGFYTFWADNASSVSESFSAEVGETKLAGMVKSISSISKEASFFLGENMKISGENDSMIKDAVLGISNFIGGDSKGGLQAGIGDAILGMNPMFPEIWKDSSFSRDYNLSFKFFSPYGSPIAIYQNVLLPFLMLVSLVTPVQTNTGSYSEPFIFQLDCPGYFACDLGICTSFTFVKGGSENLRTADGLPRQIDVTMSVKDLYPVLTSSKNNESMYFNIGMGTFLDNIAGVSMFRGMNGQADIVTRMRARVNSGLGQVFSIPGNIRSGAERILEHTPIPAIARMFNAKDRG